MKSLIKTLFLTAILFYSSFAYSQVNIESKRSDNKQKISFMSETGVNVDKGNVKVLEVFLDKRIDLNITENNKFLLLGKYTYGEANSKKFKNDFYSHIRLTSMLFFNNRLGIEEFFQFQSNEFIDLKMRSLSGFSSRIHMIKTDNSKFSSFLGIGVMKEWEELINDKNNSNYRSTNYLTLILKTDAKHQIISVTYYQPLFIDIKDYRVTSENSIIFALNKYVSLKNSLTYQYDSRPPKNIDSNNLTLKTSFIINY